MTRSAPKVLMTCFSTVWFISNSTFGTYFTTINNSHFLWFNADPLPTQDMLSPLLTHQSNFTQFDARQLHSPMPTNFNYNTFHANPFMVVHSSLSHFPGNPHNPNTPDGCALPVPTDGYMSVGDNIHANQSMLPVPNHNNLAGDDIGADQCGLLVANNINIASDNFNANQPLLLVPNLHNMARDISADQHALPVPNNNNVTRDNINANRPMPNHRSMENDTISANRHALPVPNNNNVTRDNINADRPILPMPNHRSMENDTISADQCANNNVTRDNINANQPILPMLNQRSMENDTIGAN